jgi:predicted ATP-dependent endonuclease of OLD family
MRIEFIEIANFRKLRAARVSFSMAKTVFVGANNSGKTSAMVALRYFLVPREQDNFTLNDFTLSGWPKIDFAGATWEKASGEAKSLPEVRLEDTLPFLDLWLHIEDNEVHYVRKILPTLEWIGGRIGVRLRFEPKEPQKLQADYLSARAEAVAVQQAASDDAKNGAASESQVHLWPESLTRFLERRLRSYFAVRAYVLDPTKYCDPEHGVAKPQALPEGVEPIDGDPFKGLIRIDEISAQRGFGQPGIPEGEDDIAESGVVASGTRKLSDQLRQYYNRHLDPYQKPESKDLEALGAIEEAQRAFDGRLKDGFSSALSEMEKLGYPGVTDPKLRISTRLRPVDGLNHEAAVQYIIQMSAGEAILDLRLPEDSNGLGYQNLISMVFKLMSFRDAWMRVGKAQSRMEQSEGIIAPLHLVLIEEPEAHLHTQVQQVFIRQAYQILRNHDALGIALELTTQLVVSTHSSYIAHECEFSGLRYFRRMPAKADDIPTSCVVNLTNVFGDDTDTKRFVTRYLKVTHCDLFFADAAVLIEGPAERILVPHFARNHDEFKALSESYITWLEIGGSHAHRLRELIEHLGLPTLIITDIDAIDAEGKAAPPQRLPELRSRNQTLKTWCPSTENLIELLDKPSADKIKSYDKQHFAVRVAYQCPITVRFKDVEVEAIANTLEDALVFQNIALFGGLEGKGLIQKFRAAIAESATIAELGVAIHKALNAGGKAELALDLLEMKDEKAIQPPEYIREGLLWLRAELRQHQEGLGLPGADVEHTEAAA